MLQKIRNIDPNTKALIKVVTTQVVVTAAMIAAVKVVEKKINEN
jgi:hypothetical protein